MGIILNSASTNQPSSEEERGVIVFLCLAAVLGVLKGSVE